MKVQEGMSEKFLKRLTLILLTLILLIQSSMMLYFGNLKQGFHEDELYSFLMSNWDKWQVGSSAYANEWRDSSFFFDILSVADNELFDMDVVTNNYRTDSHPPLYGYLLKFSSSVFFETFSKWIGLLPNFAISLAITVLVYFISKDISKNAGIALVTAAAWGFSVGSMSTFVFIRMYALQMLACVLLLFIHFHYRKRMLAGTTPYYVYIRLYLCSIVAFLTHFYSLVFCLFLCAFYLLEILYNKKWKTGLIYALSELLAVCTAFMLWPSMLTQLFKGQRGAEAVGNLLSFSEDYQTHLNTIIHKLDLNLLGGYWKYISLVCLILLVCLVFKLLLSQREHGQPKDKSTSRIKTHMDHLSPLIICTLLIIGYVLFVVKIAPYQSGRYYKCIYPVIIIVLFTGAHAILRKLINQPTSVAALALLMAGIIISSHHTQSVNYLSLSEQRKEVYRQYDHLPAVVLNNAGYNGRVLQWLPEYALHEQVYITKSGDIQGIGNAAATKDISDGFLLYAISFNEKDDALISEINKYVDVAYYTTLSPDQDYDLYYVRLNPSDDNASN